MADIPPSRMPLPVLTPVDVALERILEAARARSPSIETVPLAKAGLRVLMADLAARRTQPPANVSAMDGYALRAVDSDPPGKALRVIGESAAGHPYRGIVAAGEAVRIFTGAEVPEGADCVLLQERAEVEGSQMRPMIALKPGVSVRRAGLDFAAGDVLLTRGLRMTTGRIALAAAMNHAEIPVSVRPRIAFLATGDELVQPGSDDPLGIVASNSFGIRTMIEAENAEVIDLGIARDNTESLTRAFELARDMHADCLVTIGGASVGKHDLVRPVAASLGARLDFYRIAMRPGKPLNFGMLGPMLLLGLPGNPVSALVCATLFLRPLLRVLSGEVGVVPHEIEPAILGRALPANDERQDYLRATIARDQRGGLVATALDAQDSSLLSRYARAEALILRAPHAVASASGDACQIIRL